jgi:hypothetical protein
MKRRSFFSAMLVAVFALHLPLATAAEGDTKPEESWQVINLSGQRVGYGRVSTREIKRDGKTIFVTEHSERLTIKRFGQTLSIETKTRTEETAEGVLLNYEFVMNNPPASSSKTVGTIEGRKLTIVSTVAGRERTRTIDFDPATKSPGYQDRMIKQNPLKPGETRSFQIFLPEYGKPTKVKVSADDMREVKVHDGSTAKLLKVRTAMTIIPGVEIRSYIDRKGETLRTEADLFGLKMTTFKVSEEEALKKLAGAELDIAVNTLVKVANPPVNLHKSKKAIYRITTKGRNPAELLPVGGTQAVRSLSDESLELTVTAIAPPKNIQAASDQKEFIKETSFLQTTDFHVKRHARKAAAGSTDPGTVALRMEKYVHKELKKKNFSTALASAAEVAKTLEGDCTEHACLLAAMLRVERIPSRVVVGLVYAERFGAFGGHMWTEAWLDGKWIPLDGTLGAGGIGGGHIKLADSDLSDEGPAPVTSFLPLMNLLSNVKIEIVRVEQ